MLHASSSVLLFLTLQRITGMIWRSGLVAVLFGLHPLHVESVAWAAERKDVLSSFFWMLAMLMYVRYAKQSKVQSPESEVAEEEAASSIQGPESATGSSSLPDTRPPVTRHASLYYVLALGFFICGLMSKTMVVTLPLVLLLLDWWPLARCKLETQGARLRTLLPLAREKLPFFAMAFLFGMVTLHAQGAAGGVRTAFQLPMGDRVQNAIRSYWHYLAQAVWPVDLAVFYPYPSHFPVWLSVAGAVGLAGVSAIFLRASRRRPFLGFGWVWYLLTLLPVIGLLQVGDQAHADRYTYVPLVGIFVMVVWGVADFAAAWHLRAAGLWTLGILVTILCCAGTRRQLSYWSDGETLFRRALAVTGDNQVAYSNLSTALLEKGKPEEAIALLQKAVSRHPEYAKARSALGLILSWQGRLDEAITELEQASRQSPDSPNAYCALGDALAAKGRLDEAAAAYRQAIRLEPDDATACHNLGVVLGLQNRPDEAIRQFTEVIRLNPRYAEAHGNLGIALLKQGLLEKAVVALREALRLDSKLVQARHNLAVALARQGGVEEALEQFAEALKLEANSAEIRCDYGVALGKAGRWVEAVNQFQEALKLRPDYPEARSHLQLALERSKIAPDASPH